MKCYILVINIQKVSIIQVSTVDGLQRVGQLGAGFSTNDIFFFLTLLIAYIIACSEKLFSSENRAEMIYASKHEKLPSLSHQYLLMGHHSNN